MEERLCIFKANPMICRLLLCSLITAGRGTYCHLL